MTEKSTPKFMLGCTDNEAVMIDFDSTSLKQVKYWALRTMKWFKLEGFIILKSSENNYHVVFNRSVSWSENMHIVAWVSLHSRKTTMRRWLLMQCIKEESTLRVSPKGDKPSPRIVYRCGKQDKEIKNFLEYRRRIKDMLRRLETEGILENMN